MRRKYFTQLQSTQRKLSRSRQVASARVKQAARDKDIAALHEAIARGWKLEHQVQVIAQELFYRRREHTGIAHTPLPSTFEDCVVTLCHRDSLRTVRFASQLASDITRGIVGLDCKLGTLLQSANLMSILLVPTPLGDKPYQIVGISRVRQTSSNPSLSESPSQDATTSNSDTYTSEA